MIKRENDQVSKGAQFLNQQKGMRIKRSTTPRLYAVEPIVEETSPDRHLLTSESQSVLPSLKKEWGIEEAVEGSPHQFYTWERDDQSGADNSDNFLTIEEQIRQRAARVRRLELERKQKLEQEKQLKQEQR